MLIQKLGGLSRNMSVVGVVSSLVKEVREWGYQVKFFLQEETPSLAYRRLLGRNWDGEVQSSRQRETGEKILRCKAAESRFGTTIVWGCLRSIEEKQSKSLGK